MKHRFINKKTGAEARVIAMYLNSDGVMWVDGYDTVEDLMDDYAAYEPYKPEPLIKDEKIRKAVRVWAEANGREKLLVIKLGGRLEVSDGSPHLIYISFHADKGTMDNLNDRTYYTIDELCGEEE